MKTKTILLAAILLAVNLPAGGFSSEAETVLKTGGSGFGLGIMKILAEAYEKSHPDIHITIVPSLGSSGGIKAVLHGALDFAISSRALKEGENDQGGDATELARSPVVFVVNNKVEKDAISTPELEKIYGGRMDSWPDGTPIRLVLRPESESDTKIVKGLSPGMEQAVNFAQSREGMIVALTDQDTAEAVEKINGALGVSTLTQILSEKRKFKILSLNGVRPSVEGISVGSYPLAKTLYMVTSTKTPAAARQFIDFIGSQAGRKILIEYGNMVVEARKDALP
jgi:phosphate transport system substrate-binding protein